MHAVACLTWDPPVIWLEGSNSGLGRNGWGKASSISFLEHSHALSPTFLVPVLFFFFFNLMTFI